MKLFDIFRSASANMLRSKLRTFLTIIAIFIGALTLTLTNGIGSGVASYIDTQLGSIGAKDVLFVAPKAENPTSTGLVPYNPDVTTSQGARGQSVPVLTDKDIRVIQQTKGILSVKPLRGVAPDYFSFDGRKYKASTSQFIDGMTLNILYGKTITNDGDVPEVMMPINYVQTLGLSGADMVGKEIIFGVKDPAGNFTEISATVVGVQDQSLISSAGMTINSALTTKLYDVQSAGLPEAAKAQYPVATARFDIKTSDAELQAVKDSLAKNGYEAQTVEDTIGIIKQVIGAVTGVLNFFAAIALLAASFGIINTLLMAVQERTKEIGLMKAMGMRNGRIFLLFSTEAILLGFWGSLLGVLAGRGLGAIANKVASESFLKDLPGFQLTSFPLVSTLVIMLVIMTVAFIAGTLPARRAAKQNPIDALRYE